MPTMGKFKKKKGGWRLSDATKPSELKAFKAPTVGNEDKVFVHGDIKTVAINIKVLEALASYVATQTWHTKMTGTKVMMSLQEPFLLGQQGQQVQRPSTGLKGGNQTRDGQNSEEGQEKRD